jgi:hypothetical protein
VKFTYSESLTLAGRKADLSIERAFTDEAGEYVVAKHSMEPPGFRLSVRRADGTPIRSWQVLQGIWNHIAASEWAARPRDSEDAENVCHMWALPGCDALQVRLPAGRRQCETK